MAICLTISTRLYLICITTQMVYFDKIYLVLGVNQVTDSRQTLETSRYFIGPRTHQIETPLTIYGL